MTRLYKYLWLFILIFGLAACGTTPPANYYMLSAHTEASPNTHGQKHINIGLSPIDFPVYLDHNKIVVITGNNSLRTAEYHRWAEPLEGNFARVLAANLGAAMPQAEIYSFPWHPGNDIDLQLYIKVFRFDVDNHNTSRLSVRWELKDHNKKLFYPPQSRNYSITARNDDYSALVEALSLCISALSHDLAKNITAMNSHTSTAP